jgi:hypothetical protein
MKSVLGKLLGPSPITTIIGYVLAILTVIQPLLKAGTTDLFTIISAVFTALLGRAAADVKNQDSVPAEEV